MTRPRRRRPTDPVRPAAEPLEGRAYLTSPLAFAKPVVYAASATPAVPSDPAALVVADLNGDGHPDAVVANYGPVGTATAAGTGGISVLLGNGTGGFDATVSYPVGAPMQSVAVADLNGDGHPDVVAVGTDTDYVYVWMNAGNGTLDAPIALPLPAGSKPEGVAIADVNGDGHPDIITANQGVVGTGSVSVFLGTATGTFAAPVAYDGGPNPDALAVADVNGDGDPDIVTVDPENDELHVLLNRAAAADGVATALFPALPTDYVTDTTGRAVTIADVNNDARPDLVVSNLRAADVGVLLNNGDGTFQDQVTYRTGGFPFSVTVADLNGDNRPEVITADSRDNAVGVLVHNGNGGFNTRGDTNPLQFPAGNSPEAVGVADLNGDGKPDLIVADFNDGAVDVLLNQTTFGPLTATTAALSASPNPVQLGQPVTIRAAVTLTLESTLTATGPVPPSTAYPAGRVVQFLADDDRVLGDVPLAADGTATLTTTKLPAGVTAVTARYNGNDEYAPSVTALNVAVVAAGSTQDNVLLAPTAVTVTSVAGRVAPTARPTSASTAAVAAPAAAPVAGELVTLTSIVTTSSFVPGGTGTADLFVTNGGKTQATGFVALSLTLAPAADPDAAVPVTVTQGLAFNLNLAAGATAAVPVAFRLAAALAQGGYVLTATVAPTAGTFTAAQVSTGAVTTTIDVSLVPVPFVPGSPGTAAVTVTNQGPGLARGSVAVSLALQSTDDPTAAAVPVALVGPSVFAVALRGGTSRAVPVRFTVPADLAAGNYTVVATLSAGAKLTPDQVSTATAATAVAAPVAAEFGHAGGLADAVLTRTLSTGATVTLSLAGPGVGTYADAGNGAIDLTVSGTTGSSTVTVTPTSGTVAVANLSDDGRLGVVDAPTTALAGTLFVGGGARRVAFASATNSVINFGPGYPTDVAFGPVVNTSLASSATLGSVSVDSWTNDPADLIYATAVTGTLTSRGDFGARLTLSGFRRPTAIAAIDVAGTVDGTVWAFGTSAGPIAIGGSLVDTDVLAGTTLGTDGALGGNDDTFRRARIARVTIGDDVTGSLVAAGFRPASDDPFSPVGGTLLPGGAIGPVVVTGTIDAASRFAAASVQKGL